MLRPLLESDGEGEEGGRDENDPLRGAGWKRTEESRVEEEGEDAEEEEMPRFIAVGKFVHESQPTELTGVGEDDHDNDREREKNGERFQSRFSFSEIAFCVTSIRAAWRKAMAFSSVRYATS